MLKKTLPLLVCALHVAAWADCYGLNDKGKLAKMSGNCAVDSSVQPNSAAVSAAAAATAERNRVLDALHRDTVLNCYSELKSDSQELEVLRAIGCLKNYPYANSADVSKFLSTDGPLISRFANSGSSASVAAGVTQLVNQKRDRLYWLIVNSRGRSLLVGETYQFASPILSVADLSPLNLQITTTSRIIGSDEKIPFRDVKSFSYFQRGSIEIGAFTVTAANGNYLDEKFQGHFPIKYYFGDENKKWSALLAVSGTQYPEDGAPVQGSLSLSQAALNGVTVTMVDAVAANTWIAESDARMTKLKSAIELAQNEKIASRNTLMAKAKSATKGDEDSCQGTTDYMHPLSDATAVNCQLLGGRLDLGVLKQLGWLVTNVSSVPNGNDVATVIVAIKKAR